VVRVQPLLLGQVVEGGLRVQLDHRLVWTRETITLIYANSGFCVAPCRATLRDIQLGSVLIWSHVTRDTERHKNHCSFKQALSEARGSTVAQR
jgi:hypothetical protein